MGTATVKLQSPSGAFEERARRRDLAPGEALDPAALGPGLHTGVRRRLFVAEGLGPAACAAEARTDRYPASGWMS